MTPPPPKKKYAQNLYTPKIFIFLKTPKNIEIQNFNPKKWHEPTYVWKYQSIPPSLINVVLSHGMCLYQVMMMLHFLNDVANDAESTQKSKTASKSQFWRVKNG